MDWISGSQNGGKEKTLDKKEQKNLGNGCQ